MLEKYGKLKHVKLIDRLSLIFTVKKDSCLFEIVSKRKGYLMANIGVDTEAVAAAASQFNGQASQLEELIGAVSKSLSALEPLWTGPAASQFVTLMGQWNGDVTNIQQVLTQVSQRVAQAGVGYSDLDQSIARGFA
jgi:6 kDa early secretory antigenic target